MTTQLKHLFTLISLSVLCIFIVAANWDNTAPISADVVFSEGRGGYPCGTTGGLCVFSLSSGRALNPEEALGKAYLDENGNFVLEVQKADISVAKSERQFKNHLLTLYKEVVIPSEILTAVQANRSSMTLSTGDYYVEETEKEYKIVFANSGNQPQR